MKRVRRFIAMGMVLVMLAINCGLAAMAAEEIKLPKGLKVIDDEAFSGTPSIKKVVVPNKTEEIREKAFANSGVSKINMPKSIKVIDDTAFDMEFKYANTGEVIWPNSVYDGFDVQDGVVIGVSRMSYALYSESGKMKVLAFALDNKPDFTNDKEYEKRKGDYLINEDVSASRIKDAIRNHSVLINIPFERMNGVKYIRMMLGFYFNKTDETPTKWVSYGFKVFAPSLAMNRTGATMRKGDKLALNANYDPGRVKARKVKWGSENNEIAEVDQNGLVTAKSVGRTFIYAEITFGEDVYFSTGCEIFVVDAADLSKTVAGIVRKADDWETLKDISVEFWTKGASKPTATARTNSDGIYALELKNGSYTVKAVIDGNTRYEDTVKITDEARIYNISMDIARIGAWVYGISKGIAPGLPGLDIFDAEVTLLDIDGNTIGKQRRNGEGYVFYVPEGSYTLKASATGYKPGSVRVTVAKNPKNPISGYKVKFGNETVFDGGIGLVPVLYTVSGRVTDSSGKPLSGAKVRLTIHSGKFRKEVKTDAQGSFKLELPYGSYEMSVSLDTLYDTNPSNIEVNADLKPLDIRVTPHVYPRVKLVDTKGKPIAGATIEWENDVDFDTGYSNDNGFFEWINMKAGKYKLKISADGYYDKETVVTVKEDDKDIGNIVLKSYPRLSGKLVNAQGESIEDARIELLDSSDNCIGTHSSEANGDFEWINMEVGKYKLRITADGYLDKEIAATVKEEGKDLGNIVLKSYPRLTGKLVNAQGNSIAGARIELLGSSDNCIETLDSDGNGALEFTVREAGEYKFRITADDYLDKEMAVTVKEDDKDLGNIVLKSNKTTLTLSGRVVSANDDTVPVADAYVLIYFKDNGGGGGIYSETLTDSEGRFTFANLEMRLDYDYYFLVHGTNYQDYDGSSVNDWFQPSAELTGKIIKLAPLG